MNSTVPFRFRLRFAAKLPGKLPLQEPEVQFEVSEGTMLEVAARNAETLDAATNFHIDGTGFESAEAATLAAESLRVRFAFKRNSRVREALVHREHLFRLNVSTHSDSR